MYRDSQLLSEWGTPKMPKEQHRAKIWQGWANAVSMIATCCDDGRLRHVRWMMSDRGKEILAPGRTIHTEADQAYCHAQELHEFKSLESKHLVYTRIPRQAESLIPYHADRHPGQSHALARACMATCLPRASQVVSAKPNLACRVERTSLGHCTAVAISITLTKRS